MRRFSRSRLLWIAAIALTLAAMFSAAGAQETPDRVYFIYQGEPLYLTVVAGRVSVHYAAEDAGTAVAEVSEVLDGDLVLESRFLRWSLFAQDAASATHDTLAVPQGGREIVQRLLTALTDRPYMFSPVLRHDDGGEVTFGAEITAGFDPSLGEDIIEAEIAGVGGSVLERRFRKLYTICRFSVSSLRDGFEVLALANDFASRPGVSWAEPSFIYLNPQPASGPGIPDPIAGVPATSRLGRWLLVTTLAAVALSAIRKRP